MEYNIRAQSLSMLCPFSHKTEQVHVRALAYKDQLLEVAVQGCEKNYHNCPECQECTTVVDELFREMFSKQ